MTKRTGFFGFKKKDLIGEFKRWLEKDIDYGTNKEIYGNDFPFFSPEISQICIGFNDVESLENHVEFILSFDDIAGGS